MNRTGPIPRPPEERFWEKVEMIPFHACWEWMGAINHNGYGSFGRGRKREGQVRAHRFSWELHNGAIPDGMVVCHRCDNPSCVRPDHLFLGTIAENNRDCAHKGRNYNGPRPQSAKLKAVQVQEIRMLHASGRTLRSIAKHYGVTHENIRAIVHRRTWRHVS